MRVYKWIALIFLSSLLSPGAQAASQKKYYIDQIKCSGLAPQKPQEQQTKTLLRFITRNLGTTQKELSICEDLFANLGFKVDQWIYSSDLELIQKRLIKSGKFTQVKLALEKSVKRYHVILWAHLTPHPTSTGGEIIWWSTALLDQNEVNYKWKDHLKAHIDIDSEGLNQIPPARFSFDYRQHRSKAPFVNKFNQEAWEQFPLRDQMKVFLPNSTLFKSDLKFYLGRQVNHRFFIEGGATHTSFEKEEESLFDFQSMAGLEFDWWLNATWVEDLRLRLGSSMHYQSYHDLIQDIDSISFWEDLTWLPALKTWIEFDHAIFFIHLNYFRVIQNTPAYHFKGKAGLKLWQNSFLTQHLKTRVEQIKDLPFPLYQNMLTRQWKYEFKYELQFDYSLWNFPIYSILASSYDIMVIPEQQDLPNVWKVTLGIGWTNQYWNTGLNFVLESQRRH